MSEIPGAETLRQRNVRRLQEIEAKASSLTYFGIESDFGIDANENCRRLDAYRRNCRRRHAVAA